MSSRPRRVRRVARAVLGGTFDRFHVGHEALLAAAFRVGRTVAVGVTTPAYLAAHRKPLAERIQPYRTRVSAVRRYLRGAFPRRGWEVVPLTDAFGRSTGADVGALIVSEETVAGGRAVNALRRRLGRRPVPVVVVPTVRAQDLEPVSSRRIRAGTIDRNGRRRAPLGVGVSAPDPDVRDTVIGALRRTFRAPAVADAERTGPRSRRLSAGQRAKRAAVGRDLGIGVTRSRRATWSVVAVPRRDPSGLREAHGRGGGALKRALARMFVARGAKPR